MVEGGPLPDEHRCKRTDGRSWRCKRPVMEGKLLCEIHYVQGRFRNGKKQVPDALKLQRTTRTSKKPRAHPPPPASAAEDDGDDEIRVSGREHLDRKKKRKRSLVADTSEADNVAEDNTRAKAQELLRVFAKKEIGRKKKNKATAEEGTEKEKEKKRRKKKNVVVATDEQSGQEVTRDLPYGRMAISPLPESVKEPETLTNGNAAPPSVKLGSKPSNHRLVNRKFRSKNIERPPISTVKAVPYAGNARGKVGAVGVRGRKRKCHWCHRNSNVDLIKCLACKKRVFCSDCIKKRSIDVQEVKLRCLVCCGTCDCDACLTSRPKDAKSEDNIRKQCKFSKDLSLHYMITLLLPILEQINEEQRMELEMEAKFKGQSLSEVEIQRAEIGGKKHASCNKCSSSILDMHRSCPKCSYNLCLSCCQEFRGLEHGVAEHSSRKKSVSGGNVQREKKLVNKSKQNVGSVDSDSLASLPSMRMCSGNLYCASSELGGCGDSVLDLRCVFPLNYTKELEISAREMILSYELPKLLEASLQCSLCSTMAREGGSKKELLEASRRKHPGDNFLYSPSIQGDYDILLIHFQKHWQNCHPVLVRDLLEKASGLAWDPIEMFSNYLKMHLSESENDKEETCVSNCRDWYKVEFSSKESYTGSLLKTMHSSSETLKLEAELSSVFCESVFPDHYVNIFKALPIQEYTNPSSGLLNLAAKPTKGPEAPEYIPRICIACGSAEDVRKGELVNTLSYSSYDLVNIMVHASDFRPSTDELNRIKSLIKGHDLDDRIISERREVTEEAGGQTNRNTEGTTLSRGMGDPPVGIVQESITKFPGSETGSDSSVMCSGTSDGPEKPIGDMSLVDPTETSTSERESGDETPCGIQWDVFRKQDTPKLVEYVQRHSAELYNPYRSSKKLIDPILDGGFYLDSAHKMKLKDEFKIEPWTFNQKLGEAVMIPAGCLYQMKNLKSCVNVVLGFVSPENASECIKLTAKLQDLQNDNNTEVSISKVEVEKMVINKISEGIEEIRTATRKQGS